MPVEVIRGNQRQSKAIRGNQRRSEAIRGNQRRSEAIGGHRRPSERRHLQLGTCTRGYKAIEDAVESRRELDSQLGAHTGALPPHRRHPSAHDGALGHQGVVEQASFCESRRWGEARRRWGGGDGGSGGGRGSGGGGSGRWGGGGGGGSLAFSLGSSRRLPSCQNALSLTNLG